jgi:hypothetical protein
VRLTAKVVGDMLEATLGYRVEMNSYGFELVNDKLPRGRARLRCGSGIAGRSYIWALVRLPDGKQIINGLDTKAKLSRAVLEFMAGPKPGPLSNYTVPRAKRMIHPHTGTARFVWHRRLKKQQKPQVALVPFGAARR